ncbi:aldehyde dehydrogenase family protein [Amylibacter sp.]|nr:aldehyde dehydrogenase family protein [Amylibacter sp.]
MNKNILYPPSEPREFGFYIDGKPVYAGNRDLFERSSPAHGIPVSKIPRCRLEDLNAAVKSSRVAFNDRRWSGISGADRANVLLKTAGIIRSRIEEIAYWEVLENGKPITQARNEVNSCVGMFELAAGLSQTMHGDSFNNGGDNAFGIVTREPIGVVGLITPWNFPFLLLCERIPYILASGNSVVAKPSEVTSVTTLILAEIMTQAGLPEGVFNVVTGPGQSIGKYMAEHMDIDMLSFTGSTSVGRSVVAASGASNFKKLGLELGGKNPQIVFADANLDDASDGVAFGIAFNSGQCCVSGSRLLVERSVSMKFVEMLSKKLKKVNTNDPLDVDTQAGAITTDAQNSTILSYINKGLEEGATLVSGGKSIEISGGQYIEPTIFTNVTMDMVIAKEEIFGPVLVVIPFDTIEDAINIANNSEYGLAASVWTKNIDKALTISRRVQAGRFWVNTTLAGGPELPIGGFKASGWGREAGMLGVEEYTQVKSIHIETGKRVHSFD